MKNIYLVAIYLVIINTKLFACQPMPSWLPQSSFELVKEAHFIVLVKVDGQTDEVDKEFLFPILKTNVIKVFKGNFKDGNLLLVGDLSYMGASREDDFSSPRAGVTSGMCSAFDYKLDGLFLVFLNKGGKHMARISSRTNEEVSSIDSPWVRTILEYIEIDKLNDYKKEKKALKKLLTTSHGIKGLNADIERHFNMINEYKSSEDLEQRYRNTLDKFEKNKILLAFLNKKHVAGNVLFEELLSSDSWLQHVPSVTRYLVRTKAKNRIKMLLDGYYKSIKKSNEDESDSWDILGCIGVLAGKEDEKTIVKLLKANPKNYVSPFSSWLVKYSSSDLLTLVENTNATSSDYYEWLLVKMGNKSKVTWAKEHMSKDFEDRWKAYYIIAMSPLDEADILAKEIIKNATNTKDIINLIQGYEESTNKNKVIRLKEILKKYKNNKDIVYWANRSLKE